MDDHPSDGTSQAAPQGIVDQPGHTDALQPGHTNAPQPSPDDSARASFVSFLGKIIPEDSDVTRSIWLRKPVVWTMSDTFGRTIIKDDVEKSSVLRELHTSACHQVLVIEDINLDWCEALLDEFSELIQPSFLAEHIIRFEDIPGGSPEACTMVARDWAKRCPGTTLVHQSVGDFFGIALAHSDPNPTSAANGFHLDGVGVDKPDTKLLFKRITWDPENRYRRGMLQNVPLFSQHISFSTRFSCCRLPNDIYLILADKDESSRARNYLTLRVETLIFGSLDDHIAASYELPNLPPSRVLRNLFRRHRVKSVFGKRTVPLTFPGMEAIRRLLSWYIAESVCHLGVRVLEEEAQEVRHRVSTFRANEAFPVLNRLRRRFAGTRRYIAEAKKNITADMTRVRHWKVEQSDMSADEFWKAKPVFHTIATPWGLHEIQQMDARNLPDSLDSIDKRLEVLSKTINEEIQMVVGASQIEDAKTMRQQTKWTIVLGVLATIYLPMTLVTGIFGMNIVEISTEVTAPNRWSVVRAWGLVFGATIGSILLYSIAAPLLMRCWPLIRMLLRWGFWKVQIWYNLLHFFVFFIVREVFSEHWIYKKLSALKRKVKEWDIEAQKME